MPKPQREVIHRKELTLRIPVNSTKTALFCRRQDAFRHQSMAYTIQEFIATTCPGLLPHTGQTKKQLGELVKNSYDSYAARGLRLHNYLILKTVIKMNTEKISIAIKDNGGGFKKLNRHKFFSHETINYQDKQMVDGFLGGQQRGLKLFERSLEKLNGKLLLKNRKKRGASVYMVFKQISLLNKARFIR